MNVCLTKEPEIMISYKWINVMYLKMKRIKLSLNYLSLIMNIQASTDRVFPFIFLLEDGLSFKKNRGEKAHIK